MSNKLNYSVAVLLALTVGTTAIAQTPKGMKMLGMSDFEEFDINKDGKVSKEENQRAKRNCCSVDGS